MSDEERVDAADRFLDADKDSAAYASAMLWGGRPGQTWFSALAESMRAADEKAGQ